MKFLAVLTLAGVFITSTSAHGGVTEYVIGGKTILGWQPYNSPNGQSTIQRQWSTYDPLYQASDSKSKCNTPGTGPAAQVATVAAGSQVTAKWKQEGPVMVYMARVNGNSFSDSDGNGQVWFKIAETGLIIALHQANAPQFYMQCAQLEVTGSGNVVPTSNLASFPGTYRQNDPGIMVDVYSSTATSYTPPGPRVFTC